MSKNLRKQKIQQRGNSDGFEWKFGVIQKTPDEADNQPSVNKLCEIAGVSRSGYCRWVKVDFVLGTVAKLIYMTPIKNNLPWG